MRMINALVSLFTEADALFYVLFVLAFVLFIFEAIIPSFGVLGVGGILLSLGAIIERCFSTDLGGLDIFLYILYIVLIYIIAVVITKLINKLRIHIKTRKKYAIVNNVKVPLTSEGNLDYSFLLGKEGEVVSDLKPTGKIQIDEHVFDATTSKGYIYSGTKIVVDKVIAQRIIVKKKF